MQYHAELAKASTFYIWSLIILTFASVSAQLSTWSIKKTSLDFCNFQFEINHITRANETVVQLKVFTKASTSKFIDAIVTRYNWQFDTFQNNLQSGIIILMSTSLIAFIRHTVFHSTWYRPFAPNWSLPHPLAKQDTPSKTSSCWGRHATLTFSAMVTGSARNNNAMSLNWLPLRYSGWIT